MSAAAYAAMSDPDRNWNFRRRWTGPPNRKRRPGQGTAFEAQIINTNNTYYITSGSPEEADAIRWAIERLGLSSEFCREDGTPIRSASVGERGGR